MCNIIYNKFSKITQILEIEVGKTAIVEFEI